MPPSPHFAFIDEANLQRPEHLGIGSTHTAPYSAPNAPPVQQIPIHIVFDCELLQKMRGSLRTYLMTKCGMRPVPNGLFTRLHFAQETTAADLTSETTARFFFVEHVKPLVSAFVFDVDGVGVRLEEAPTSYGAKPDPIWGGRVHIEFKSHRALLHHAPEILDMGKANGGRGSALVLGGEETDGRSIIFKIGISMVSKSCTWGILTSGLVSMFFHRHVILDTKGDSHHILSCSELVYIDAASPSVFSLCAATLLGAQDSPGLVVRPVRLRITIQPYPLAQAASPSRATRSQSCQMKGKPTARRSSIQNPHARQRLYPMKCSRTLSGVRKVTTFEYRVGVRARGQRLWKCPTLRVQFVVSYWPDLVYNVRRVSSDTSLFSGHTGRGTCCRFPPPHLKLYERLGRGETGQVHDGVVSVPQSRTTHAVVAKLFLRAHLNKLHNEIHLYRTRLVRLRNKAVPKVFGAFVTRGSSKAAVGTTMDKWGIIVMEKCGSAVQSVDELTVDQKKAAYRCLCLIHQAGVKHCDFHLNNILFSSDRVRVIDFSEAVEHDHCSGPDCYELRRAREYLELPA